MIAPSPQKDARPLTTKEKRFADAYIRTSNAAEAGRIAGYKAKGARQSAYRCLQRQHVKDYVEEGLRRNIEKAEITPEKVKQGLHEIAFDKKVNAKDRITALELIGKILKMFDAPSTSGNINLINVIGELPKPKKVKNLEDVQAIKAEEVEEAQEVKPETVDVDAKSGELEIFVDSCS